MKLNAIIAGLAICYISIAAGIAIGKARGQDEYNQLLTKWNSYAATYNAKQMYGTGEWYCGKMVVSCNKDGYLNMDGNIPAKK